LKKFLSIILAISMIFSCFSMLSGTVLAADFPELTTTKTFSFQKSGTMTYANTDALFAAGWNGYQINTTQGSLGSALEDNLTAVTFDTAYPSVEEDYYADYGVTFTSNKHTVYADSTLVDWNDTIVDSVTYTFVPKAFGDVRYSQHKGAIIPIGMDGKALMAYVDGQGNVRFTSKVGTIENNAYTVATYKYNDATVIQNTFPGYNSTNQIYGDNGLAAEMTVKINYEKTETIDETSGNYIYKVASIEYSISDDVVIGNSGTAITSNYKYSSGNTLTVTPSVEISTAYPMVAIPTTAAIETSLGYAQLQQTYTKNITVVSHTEPDTHIADFLAKYDAIDELTVDTLAQLETSSAEFIAYSKAIEETLAIYENYDANHKNYVGEDRYNHLADLDAQIYKMVEIKEASKKIKYSGSLMDDFSDAAFTNNAWKFNIIGASENGYNPTTTPGGFFTTKASATNPVLSEQNSFRRYGFSSQANVIPTCVDSSVNDGKLNINFDVPQGNYSNKTEASSTFSLQTQAFQATVNPDFVPDDIKRISGKLRLEAGSVMLLFGDLEGNNYPINATTTDAQKDEIPTVGIIINISETGTMTYNLVKLNNATVTGDSRDYIKTGDSLYYFAQSNAIVDNYQGSNLKTGVLDMSKEYFTFALEFTTATYSGNSVVIPKLTLSDGLTTLSGQLRNNSISANYGPYYATSVTGLSIGQFIAEDVDTSASAKGVYKSTVEIDDVEILGTSAVSVDGATIKTTENPSEQDIKFVMNFDDENAALLADGYTVKEYGAIVAVKGALKDADAPLTFDSVYADAYASTFGAPVKVPADNKDIPEGEVTLTIGESAAGAERLGLIYRVRAFAVYEKEGAEDVVVYSATGCDRSIYSTAKKIAKTIQGMNGFVANETYNVAGRATTYAEIEAVINGSEKSSTTLADSTVTYGEAIIAFTAAHSSLFANS